MLWDNIFYFFVRYVFGGYVANERYLGTLGLGYNGSNWQALDTSLARSGITISVAGLDWNMPLGNYLSMIATIISITFIVILCCLFVYKIIKLIGGLIR